ncbi:MAG: tRNA (N6-threonylcarbamoyladenosine(37)-N6)-methyltransferase TrmO [Thermodesulfobacteriota bacterium]
MAEPVVFTPIGLVRSPFQKVEDMPLQSAGALEVLGSAELLPEYAPALADLDGFSHLILLYCFHRAKPYAPQVTPFLDTTPRGLFATRAPSRPNPIGFSVVELLAVEGHVLRLRGVDILDNTPLLDLKPWVPAFDVPLQGEVRAGWLARCAKRAADARSDDRFKG